MNKILLLTISVMLGSLLVHALKCHVCKKYIPGKGCLIGKSFCDASPGNECMSVVVKKGKGKVYQKRGCSKTPQDCNRAVTVLTKTKSTRCCDDKDLCNEY